MAESQYKVLMLPVDPDGQEALELLKSRNLPHIFNIFPEDAPIVLEEQAQHGWSTMPLIYSDTQFLGGLEELREHLRQMEVPISPEQDRHNEDESPDETPREDQPEEQRISKQNGNEECSTDEMEFEIKLLAAKKLKEKLSLEHLNKVLIELEDLPEQYEIMIFQRKKLVGYLSSSSDTSSGD